MLVRILGGIDLLSAVVFLMYIFGINVFTPLVLFCAGLLFLKGLFIFTLEPLSAVDLASSVVLIISIFFVLPSIFLWIPAFLLLAKAIVSFI